MMQVYVTYLISLCQLDAEGEISPVSCQDKEFRGVSTYSWVAL